VIAGGRDPVSGNASQIGPWIEDYRKSGCTNLEFRIYPEARHELFNETNREEVTAELISWLDKLAVNG